MKTNMQIAVVQVHYAVFGIGDTLADAIREANKYTSDPISTKSFGDVRTHGDMVAVSITPALAERVAIDGTTAFEIRRGVAMTPEEAIAQE